MTQNREYTHLALDQDCNCLVGHYTPQKEARMAYEGREVLYVVGQAVIEAACCSAPGTWSYVLVPGYVVEWQKKTGEAGLPVSEVEPISDTRTQAELRRIIQEKECVRQVDFW